MKAEPMYKLSHLVDGEWIEHRHLPVYEAHEHLLAGVPGGDPLVFQRVVECLEPPYFLLYVLHTPRGEAESGRYQSQAVSKVEFIGFVNQFSSFLQADARFDLWAHSPSEGATVVWDRHNQLFAYGPTERFALVLMSMGFQPGEVRVLAHSHHYRGEFDDAARELLQALEWTHTPLRPEDGQ